MWLIRKIKTFMLERKVKKDIQEFKNFYKNDNRFKIEFERFIITHMSLYLDKPFMLQDDFEIISTKMNESRNYADLSKILKEILEDYCYQKSLINKTAVSSPAEFFNLILKEDLK